MEQEVNEIDKLGGDSNNQKYTTRERYRYSCVVMELIKS